MHQIATMPRATRYDLSTRVVYRREGEEVWQEGQAVNVSRTGVLFEAEGASLPLQAPIEFVLELPHVTPGHAARVRCRGRVARCCGQASMAATIDSYSFLEAGGAPA